MSTASQNPTRSRDTVTFEVTISDSAVINKIARRAFDLAKGYGRKRKAINYAMDLTAVHANGNPLRLADLLAADNFNFIHDVFGIERHLDRDTGKLGNCFRPRFSQRAA